MVFDSMPKNGGFTLVELIAVAAIIAIMLVVAVPLFENTYAFNAERKALNLLMATLESVKRKAVCEQKDYRVHFNFERGRIWVSELIRQAGKFETVGTGGFVLPQELRLRDLEYSARGKVSTGEADIFFSRKDFSDRVMIHLEGAQYEDITIRVEAFQTAVKRFDAYVAFEK